jgi:hypothetical protein
VSQAVVQAAYQNKPIQEKIIDHIVNRFGWNRNTVSRSGALAPVVGRLVAGIDTSIEKRGFVIKVNIAVVVDVLRGLTGRFFVWSKFGQEPIFLRLMKEAMYFYGAEEELGFSQFTVCHDRPPSGTMTESTESTCRHIHDEMQEMVSERDTILDSNVDGFWSVGELWPGRPFFLIDLPNHRIPVPADQRFEPIVKDSLRPFMKGAENVLAPVIFQYLDGDLTVTSALCLRKDGDFVVSFRLYKP